MAQLAQGLGFDLPDPLARDVELSPYLLQRAVPAIHQPEAQPEHVALARQEAFQHAIDLLAQQLPRGDVGGPERGLVGNKIGQRAFILFADRGLERDGLERDLEDLAHLFGREPELASELLTGGIAPHLLEEPLGDAHQLVDGLYHVYGDADRPRSEE